MKTKNAKLFRVLMILVCLVLALSMVACSERQKDDEVNNGGNNNVVDEDQYPTESIDKATAFAEIDKSMSYLDQGFYKNPQWLSINTTIDLDFHTFTKEGLTYTTVPKSRTELVLTVMANISLVDNSQSVVFIELNNTYGGYTILGLYYYDSTTYLVLGTKKYYTEQLNMTKIGQTIVKALEMGTESEVDIPEIVGKALQSIINIPSNPKIGTIIKTAWTMLFNQYTISYSDEKYTYTTKEEGRDVTHTVPKYRYINEYLNINEFLGQMNSGVIDLYGFYQLPLNWEAFGLPDLDNIMEDILGFNLRMIREKDWPNMACSLHAITEMKPVTLGDGSSGYEYIFNGVGFSVYPDNKEFDLVLRATPFVMEVSDEKRVPIALSGYDFGEGGKGTTYEKGSLTNLELNLRIGVDMPSGGKITLHDILGNIVNLGEIGTIPLNIEPATKYLFDLEIAASLDLFDNKNNYLQAKLKYNLKEVFAIYLAPDTRDTVIDGKVYRLNTLYFDFHNLISGGEQFLPNTKISKINLTQSIASMLGEEVMTYLDPYRGDTTASRNAADNAVSTEIDKPLGVNVMKIIELLITEKEDGKNGDKYKYLLLPRKENPNKGYVANSVFKLRLDNFAINELMSMFVGGMTLIEEDNGVKRYENGIGLEKVEFSIDFKQPFDSINLTATIAGNNKVFVSIGKDNGDGTYGKGLSYFTMPEFEMSAIGINKGFIVNEDAEALRSQYRELESSLSYTATVTGNLAIGSTGGTTINLDGLMDYLIQNLFASLGFNKGDILASIGIGSSSELNIGYEIQLGTSLMNMAKTSVTIDLYLLDRDNEKLYNGPFIELYYQGDSDTLFINTQVQAEGFTEQLHRYLPISRIIDGRIPQLSVTETGIASALSGIAIDPNGLLDILGVMGREGASNLSFNLSNSSFTVNNDGNVEIDEETSAGFDVFKLIGNAIDSVLVKDGRLGVILNSELLTVLLGMLNMEINGLPQVNGSLYVHLGTANTFSESTGKKLYYQNLYGVLEDNGKTPADAYTIYYIGDDGQVYDAVTDELLKGENIKSVLTYNELLKGEELVRAHIGLVDSNGTETESFYVDLNLIDTLNITRTNIVTPKGAFATSNFKSIAEWSKTLKLSVDVELEFALSSSAEDAEWDKLSSIVEEILGDNEVSDSVGEFVKSLVLRLKNEYFYNNGEGTDKGLKLGIAVKGTIDVNDLFASELGLVIFDKQENTQVGYRASNGITYQIIAGLYLQDERLMLDLEYFGIDLLSISDIRTAYDKIMAAQFDTLWAETIVFQKDATTGSSVAVATFEEKEAFIDEVYRQVMLEYFFDNQYEVYVSKQLPGKAYFKTQYPTSRYKYFIFNDRVLRAGDDDDYSNLYYGDLRRDYSIYIYDINELLPYFYVGERDNTLKLRDTENAFYKVLVNGKIGIYEKANSVVPSFTISPTLFNSEGSTVPANIVVLQEELETNSFGTSELNEENFGYKIKAEAKSQYEDYLEKYAGYWNALTANVSISDPDYVNVIMPTYDRILQAQREYWRIDYINSSTYVTDRTALSTAVLEGLRSEFPGKTLAYIRQTDRYLKLFREREQEMIESYVKAQENNKKMGDTDIKAFAMLELIKTVTAAKVNKKLADSDKPTLYNASARVSEVTNEIIASYASLDPSSDTEKSTVTDAGEIALKVIYNTGRITFELTSGVIARIFKIIGYENLGEYLDINYAGILVDVSDGMELEVLVNLIDLYSIRLSIVQLKASVDETKEGDYKIVTNKDFPEGADGVPNAIEVEASVEISISNVIGKENLEQGATGSDYDLTALLNKLLSGSAFKSSYLKEYFTEATLGSTESDVLKKSKAWRMLYDDGSTNATQKAEMDSVLVKAWAKIVENKDGLEEYAIYAKNGERCDGHYAVAWDLLEKGSVKVDLNELDIEFLAQIFGNNINATLRFDAKAWINFSSFYRSSVQLVATRIIEEENGTKFQEEVLRIFYDGSVIPESELADELTGTVYISTDIFGIGNIIFEDITTAWTSLYNTFDSEFIKTIVESVYDFFGLESDYGDEETAAFRAQSAAVKAGTAPMNAPSSSARAVSAKTYIDLLFKKGMLGIGLGKDSLVNMLRIFTGTDIAEELKEIDFGVNVFANFDNQLGADVIITIADNQTDKNGNYTGDVTTIKVSVGKINIGMEQSIYPPNDPRSDGYDADEIFRTVESFDRVGIAIGGYADFEISKINGTNFNFDYLFEMLYKEILEGREPEIGMQLDIAPGDVFKQKNYLEIRANTSLITLENLTNLELYLAITTENNHKIYTDLAARRELMKKIELEANGVYSRAWDRLMTEMNKSTAGIGNYDEEYKGLIEDDLYFASVMTSVGSMYQNYTGEERYEKLWNELYGRCGDYYLGNVLSLYVILDEREETATELGKSKIYGKIYIDLAFLGVEPIVLDDVSEFIQMLARKFGLDLSQLFEGGKQTSETDKIIAAMETIIVENEGDKVAAWDEFTDKENAYLSETKAEEVAAFYNKIAGNAAVFNCDEETVKSVAWDAYYWQVVGVKRGSFDSDYEYITSIYPEETTDIDVLTLAQFNSITEMNIKSDETVIADMESLLIAQIGRKQDAWKQLISDSNTVLSVLQKKDAATLIGRIISKNAQNNYGKTDNQLRIVAWDAYYWSIAGIRYNAGTANSEYEYVTSLYPDIDTKDTSITTLAQFMEMTGMEIKVPAASNAYGEATQVVSSARNASNDTTSPDFVSLGQIFVGLNTAKDSAFLIGDVTSAAFYSILMALGVTDVEKLFGEEPEIREDGDKTYYPGYSPSFDITILDKNEDNETDLIQIGLELENFCDLGIAITTPTIDIAQGDKRITIREYKYDNEYNRYVENYTTLDKAWDTSAKVSVEGEFTFKAKEDEVGNGSSVLNFGDLLRTLLGDKFNIDLLLDTQETIDNNLYFYLDLSINIMSIYALLKKDEYGLSMMDKLTIPEILGIAGVELSLEIVSREKAKDKNGAVLKDPRTGKEIISKETVIVGIYLVKETAGDGTEYLSLFVDLSSFHISPIKLENLTETGSAIWKKLLTLMGMNEAEQAQNAAEYEMENYQLLTAVRAYEMLNAMAAAGGNEDRLDIDVLKNAAASEGATGTAMEDAIRLVIGNNYGLTIQAVSAVLIKLLDEAFNDERSLARRAFEDLIQDKYLSDLEKEKLEIEVLIANMDSLLNESSSGNKTIAWESLIDEDGNILNEERRNDALKLNDKVKANGKMYSKTDEQVAAIAWDAYYWQIAGIKYDEDEFDSIYEYVTSIYPDVVTSDGNVTTYEQFCKITGMEIDNESSGSVINGIYNDVLNEIGDIDKINKYVLMEAVELSEYYYEGTALESYISYVQTMLKYIDNAYMLALTAIGSDSSGDRIVNVGAAAFDNIITNGGISSDDIKMFGDWKDSFSQRVGSTELGAKYEAWNYLNLWYNNAYNNVIAAMETANEATVEIYGEKEITEVPFKITENVATKKKEYDIATGFDNRFTAIWKAYVWEKLVETYTIEDIYVEKFISEAITAAAGVYKKFGENAYKYYAWEMYTADVENIYGGDYSGIIRRDCEYVYVQDPTDKNEWSYTVNKFTDIDGKTVWYYEPIEAELPDKFDDYYENAYSTLPAQIVKAANGTGTATVGFLYKDRLLGVDIELGNFEIGMYFVRAGLYLKESGLKKVIYSEEINAAGLPVQASEEVEMVDYLHEKDSSALQETGKEFFAEFNEDFKYVYASLQLDFNIDTDVTSYNLKNLIDKVFADLGFDIELNNNIIGLEVILNTLRSFSKHFRLDIEAKANIFDLTTGNFNTTDLAITLYAIDADGNVTDKILQLVLGSYLEENDEGETENKSFVYIDFSRFNIQRVIIWDAIEYVRNLLGGEAAKALAPYAPANASSAMELVGDMVMYGYYKDLNDKYEAAKAAGDNAEIEEINVIIQKSGVSTQIASGAIYALLNFIGLGIIEDYVSLALDVSLELDIFAVDKDEDGRIPSDYDDSDRDLIRLSMEFNSLGTNDIASTGGVRVDFGIHTINVSLDQEQFVLNTESSEDLLNKLELPVDKNTGEKKYAEISATLPNIVLSTTIEFKFDAHKSGEADFNKSPVKDILNGLTEDGNLAEVIGRILFEVADNHSLNVALDIDAEIDLGTGEDTEFLRHIIEGSLVRIQIRAWYENYDEPVNDKNKIWATITYYNGNLYIDLSELNIRKIKIMDAGSLVFGSGEKAENAWADVAETWRAASLGITNKEYITVNGYANTVGAYLLVEYKALSKLISVLGFGGLDIFNDAVAGLFFETYTVDKETGAKSFQIGINLAFNTVNNNIFESDDDRANSVLDNETVGIRLAVKGLYIGFQRLRSESWEPTGVNDYINIYDIHVLEFTTAAELNLGDETGMYDLKELAKAVLAKLNVDLASLGLSKTLQPIIEILESRSVKFKMSVKLSVYIGEMMTDIMNGRTPELFDNLDILELLDLIQAQIVIDIYKDGAETATSTIMLAYMNGSLYIDLSGLNKTLGKVRVGDVYEAIGTLMGGVSTASQSSEFVKNSANSALEAINGFIRAFAPSNATKAVSDTELLDSYVKLLLDGREGMTVTIIYGAVYSVLKNILKLDSVAEILDVVSLTANPSVSANLGYDLVLGVTVNIPGTMYNDDDFIAINGLIDDAKENYGYTDETIELFENRKLVQNVNSDENPDLFTEGNRTYMHNAYLSKAVLDRITVLSSDSDEVKDIKAELSKRVYMDDGYKASAIVNMLARIRTANVDFPSYRDEVVAMFNEVLAKIKEIYPDFTDNAVKAMLYNMLLAVDLDIPSTTEVNENEYYVQYILGTEGYYEIENVFLPTNADITICSTQKGKLLGLLRACEGNSVTAIDSFVQIISNTELYALYTKPVVEKIKTVDMLISESNKYKSLYGTGLLFDGESVSIHLKNLMARYSFYDEDECKEILYDYLLIGAYERTATEIVRIIVAEDKATSKALDTFVIDGEHIYDLFEDYAIENRRLDKETYTLNFYNEVLKQKAETLVANYDIYNRYFGGTKTESVTEAEAGKIIEESIGLSVKAYNSYLKDTYAYGIASFIETMNAMTVAYIKGTIVARDAWLMLIGNEIKYVDNGNLVIHTNKYDEIYYDLLEIAWDDRYETLVNDIAECEKELESVSGSKADYLTYRSAVKVMNSIADKSSSEYLAAKASAESAKAGYEAYAAVAERYLELQTQYAYMSYAYEYAANATDENVKAIAYERMADVIKSDASSDYIGMRDDDEVIQKQKLWREIMLYTYYSDLAVELISGEVLFDDISEEEAREFMRLIISGQQSYTRAVLTGSEVSDAEDLMPLEADETSIAYDIIFDIGAAIDGIDRVYGGSAYDIIDRIAYYTGMLFLNETVYVDADDFVVITEDTVLPEENPSVWVFNMATNKLERKKQYFITSVTDKKNVTTYHCAYYTHENEYKLTNYAYLREKLGVNVIDEEFVADLFYGVREIYTDTLMKLRATSMTYTDYMGRGFSADAWDDLIGNVDFNAESFELLWADILSKNVLIGDELQLQGRLYGEINETTDVYELNSKIKYIVENVYFEYNYAKENSIADATKYFNELLGSAIKGTTIGEYRPDLVELIKNEEANNTVTEGLSNAVIGAAALAYYAMPASSDKSAALSLAETIFANAGVTDYDNLLLYAIAYGTLVKTLKSKMNEDDTDIESEKAWERAIRSYELFNRGEFIQGTYVSDAGTTETVRINAVQFAHVANLLYETGTASVKGKIERAAYYYAAIASESEFAVLETKKANGTINAIESIILANGSTESLVKATAYRRLLRNSSTYDMYRDFYDIRSSIVFEMIYRNYEDARNGLKAIIERTADETIDNMANGIKGSSIEFNADNINIYYEIFGDDFSEQFAELIMEGIYDDTVSSLFSSANTVVEDLIYRLVYEILYKKLTLYETATAVINIYNYAAKLIREDNIGGYPTFEEFYKEFDFDIKEFVVDYENIDTVTEEMFLENYDDIVVLRNLTVNEFYSYYKYLCEYFARLINDEIISTMKPIVADLIKGGNLGVIEDMISVVDKYLSIGTSGIFCADISDTITDLDAYKEEILALYGSSYDYNDVLDPAITVIEKDVSSNTVDNAGGVLNQKKTTVTKKAQASFTANEKDTNSVLTGGFSLNSLLEISSINVFSYDEEEGSDIVKLDNGEYVLKEWINTELYTGAFENIYIREQYLDDRGDENAVYSGSPETYTYSYTYKEDMSVGSDPSAINAEREKAEAAAREAIANQINEANKRSTIFVKSKYYEDVNKVKEFVKYLTGEKTYSATTLGYFKSEYSAFANLHDRVMAIENAEDLYLYTNKMINSRNYWALTTGDGKTDFTTYKLNALKEYYRYINPDDTRNYYKEYYRFDALISTAETLVKENGVVFDAQQKLALNAVYDIQDAMAYVIEPILGATFTAANARQIIYYLYENYYNKGGWVSSSDIISNTDKTMQDLFESLREEVIYLSFTHFADGLYLLFDEMVNAGAVAYTYKSQTEKARMQLTKERYDAFNVEIRKEETDFEERSALVDILHQIIFGLSMTPDEETLIQRPITVKDKFGNLSLQKEDMYFTGEELLIVANELYEQMKEAAGGVVRDYKLVTYNNFTSNYINDKVKYVVLNLRDIVNSVDFSVSDKVVGKTGSEFTEELTAVYDEMYSVIYSEYAYMYSNVFVDDGMPLSISADGKTYVLSDKDATNKQSITFDITDLSTVKVTDNIGSTVTLEEARKNAEFNDIIEKYDLISSYDIAKLVEAVDLTQYDAEYKSYIEFVRNFSVGIKESQAEASDKRAKTADVKRSLPKDA